MICPPDIYYSFTPPTVKTCFPVSRTVDVFETTRTPLILAQLYGGCIYKYSLDETSDN